MGEPHRHEVSGVTHCKLKQCKGATPLLRFSGPLNGQECKAQIFKASISGSIRGCTKAGQARVEERAEGRAGLPGQNQRDRPRQERS